MSNSYNKLGVFASLNTATDTTIIVAGIYYPIAGTFDNVIVGGFELVATPAIKCLCDVKKYYEVDWHASCSGNSNGITVHCGIKVAGALESHSVMGTYLKTANEAQALSGTVVVA